MNDNERDGSAPGHSPATLPSAAEGTLDHVIVVLKALSNGPRMQSLITLSTGEQCFHALLKVTRLQKTALANHLGQLIDAGLISKPNYGKYAITGDGTLFLTSIMEAFSRSLLKARFEADRIARGGMSASFLGDFFGGIAPG